ncbi:MAG: RES superfamily protein [Sphingobacteriaceae bacterium]|nr:RES superfamily protein [Sphingobacteriaceae bacterium]
MEVYRLVREPYALPLSGKGAAIKGGRWNSIGVEVLYTATNRSLAMAEVAVHFTLATLPPDYVMMRLQLPPNASLDKLDIATLPPQWKMFPPSTVTQRLGDAFLLAGKALGLLVPSVVTQGDFNLLLNPHHPQFGEIAILSIEKFPFDHRIFAD